MLRFSTKNRRLPGLLRYWESDVHHKTRATAPLRPSLESMFNLESTLRKPWLKRATGTDKVQLAGVRPGWAEGWRRWESELMAEGSDLYKVWDWLQYRGPSVGNVVPALASSLTVGKWLCWGRHRKLGQNVTFLVEGIEDAKAMNSRHCGQFEGFWIYLHSRKEGIYQNQGIKLRVWALILQHDVVICKAHEISYINKHKIVK